MSGTPFSATNYRSAKDWKAVSISSHVALYSASICARGILGSMNLPSTTFLCSSREAAVVGGGRQNDSAQGGVREGGEGGVHHVGRMSHARQEARKGILYPCVKN